MKNIKIKACAVLLTAMMLMSSSCSFVDSFKDDVEARRTKREEDQDKKDKKDKEKKNRDKDKDTEESEETEETEDTEETTTEADPTEAPDPTDEPAPTTAPTTVKDSEYAKYLIFPDEPYDYDKVHPEHKPGNITGKEAKEELDKIEHDYLVDVFSDDYIDAVIYFDDCEALDIDLSEPSWGDVSFAATEDDIKDTQEYLDRLYAIDYESLDESDRVFYEKITYDIEQELYMEQYPGYNFLTPVFNSFTSQQCEILFVLDVISFKTKEDAENYIAVLKDIDRYYDELCTFEEARVELGYAGSDELYDGVVESFENLVKQKDDCFLYESFEKRLDNIKGLSDDDREQLIKDHEDAMKNVVFPEFEECAKRMGALKGNCKNEQGGLCGFEHGKELYDIVMMNKSNSSITPQEAADELDKQLKVLYGKILSTWEYMDHDYTAGDLQENLDSLYDQIFEYFPEIPEHKYNFMTVPDVFKDSFSPAAYLGYHIDSYDDNMLLVNSAADNADFGTVVAHEAYPGHMYQSLYTRSISDHYYMVIFDSIGYAEGWAQYVEVNSPLFFGASDDAVDAFVVESLLDLYLMGRCDIGYNYEGWTNEDAVDHFTEIFGMSLLTEDGLDWTKEICTANPGYPLPYAMGYYEITKTLDAIFALDDTMDVKTLHTIYLNAQTGTYEQILESAKRQLGK